MSAYAILGLILIGIVVIAILIAAFERGPCTPVDYQRERKWKK